MTFAELPDVATDLSCKSSNPPTNPEVAVDVQNGDEWVRIPVVRDDLWIERDGPADITRTAKVTFPAEWDGISITQFVDAFTEEDIEGDGAVTYDQARLWHQDSDDGTWVCDHYGFLGGLGAADQTGVLKLWIYDVADFLRGINVSKAWTDPTIAEILRFVTNGTDDRDVDVGVSKRTIFGTIPTVVVSPEGAALQKVTENSDGYGPLDLQFESQQLTLTEQSLSTPMAFTAGLENGPLLGELVDAGQGILTGDFNEAALINFEYQPPQQSFSANRHNLIDVLKWLSKEAGGKWHFEPTPFGPVLIFDTSLNENLDTQFNNVFHRHFKEQEVADDTSPLFDVPTDGVFKDVSTIDNDAIVDIKPINSLEVLGATTNNPNVSVFGPDSDGDVVTVEPQTGTVTPPLEEPNFDAASTAPEGSVYPYVKVTSPRLLQRAGGYEYGPQPVESDTTELDEAVNTAIDEYRQHIAGGTEGTVTLRGEPYILPYDYLTTITVCNNIFPNADSPVITYEVQSVHHYREAGVPYQTECDVSLTFNEDNLDITATYREA